MLVPWVIWSAEGLGWPTTLKASANRAGSLALHLHRRVNQTDDLAVDGRFRIEQDVGGRAGDEIVCTGAGGSTR